MQTICLLSWKETGAFHLEIHPVSEFQSYLEEG